MKIKLKNENQKFTSAGFGIDELFENGKLMVKNILCSFFCSRYINIKTLSYPEIALKLLYLS